MLLVYGTGVLAATNLGKVAPAAPPLRDDVGLSLGLLGWLISAITAVAALLGTPAGLWVRRRGGRRALLAGLAVLAAAGTAGAAAPGAGWMLAARVAEGVGFLLVVVAAPTLMTQMADREHQPAVLALWGTAIAVGLAASAAAGGVLAPLGWRPWLAAPAVLALPLAAAVALLVPPGPPGHPPGVPRTPPDPPGHPPGVPRTPPDPPGHPPGVPRTPPAAADPRGRAAGAAAAAPDRAAGVPARLRAADLRVPALLAGGFCAVVAIASALLGMLPTFLVDAQGGGSAAAGSATALVALSSVLGSLVAGWLLGRGLGTRALLAAGLLMPLAAWPVVRTGGSFGASVLAAAALLAANGVVVAAVFAAVPRMAAAPDHLAVVNGLIAQLGSVGTLLGPPLFALAVAAAGWGTFPPLVAAVTGLGLAALLLAEKGAAAR